VALYRGFTARGVMNAPCERVLIRSFPSVQTFQLTWDVFHFLRSIFLCRYNQYIRQAWLLRSETLAGIRVKCPSLSSGCHQKCLPSIKFNAFRFSSCRVLIQDVPGNKVTTSGFNSRVDSESKMSYTHGSNSQRFRSYEF